jgi:16S rRNA (uracil1498-N3)-methyltransferase
VSAPWFYVSDIPDVDGVAMLDERESRHALGSRRLRESDPVCLFDGRGVEAAATLVEIDTRAGCVRARVAERSAVPAPSPVVHLVCALPKGDRQSTLLNMATQLGMASFAPLSCERAVARPSSGFAERALRIFIEACKQSRRPHLPELRDAIAPGDVGHNAWIADPGGEPFGARVRAGVDGPLTLVIGPEGGLSEAEVAAATAAGAVPVSLGDRILRIETAAVAALAAVML